MSGSMRGVWKRSYGRATKAPPDERGGKQTCPAYRHRATFRLTWACSRQGFGFNYYGSALIVCFGIQVEPVSMIRWFPYQIQLTYGRRSQRLHQYPAFDGWGLRERDHSLPRLFRPCRKSVRCPGSVRADQALGMGSCVAVTPLRSGGLHEGAVDDDAAGCIFPEGD